ncbi:MAG: hypothetical protein WCS42_13120 [Verrucomicrobiota bacterium]
MENPEIQELRGQIAFLTAWVSRLAAAEVAARRVMFELAPTFSPAQSNILAQYPRYARAQQEAAMLEFEKTNPEAAAMLESISPTQPEPPPGA